MSIITGGGNGISPLTSTPPLNVAPTSAGYEVSFGAIEELADNGDAIPVGMEGEGLPSYNLTYHFEEFYLEVQAGAIVKVDIAGQTIDWAASEISQNGTISVNLGIDRPYDLVGKSLLGQQYTFLSCEVILVESGVPKPVSWVVRMKHSQGPPGPPG